MYRRGSLALHVVWDHIYEVGRDWDGTHIIEVVEWYAWDNIFVLYGSFNFLRSIVGTDLDIWPTNFSLLGVSYFLHKGVKLPDPDPYL